MKTSEELYLLAERLAPLSGMQYCSGYYTVQEWIEKTGVDPLDFPGYITVTSAGFCVWTAKSERLVSAFSYSVRRNWNALGVAV